ncbi:alpha-L-fucosidase [Paenibacillus sp. LMG 31460]|uniref:Alpha-L-fucosidase n=1 Tax=Paenibacillus germinis TaxID=2654979 RepID=A0ABX1Z5N8_9BACL|nr:hypothetical protein [Paenibacillus germinis]NOU88693.1 alpha-L-fucosidase [Paenibacillus germinis]
MDWKLHEQIDWNSFMEQHDLIWNEKPKSWNEGAFMGNGLLGAMIYSESHNEIAWHIGRTDVTQRADNVEPIAGKYRIPIGKLVLQTQGKIQECSMRLDLWNAEIRCRLLTDRGEITWQTFTHAEHHVVAIECQSIGEEQAASWKWMPAKAENPRVVFHKLRGVQGPNEIPNPEVRWEQDGDIRITVQELESGGEYATAWMEVGNHNVSSSSKAIYLSVGFSYPDHYGKQESVNVIRKAAAIGFSKLQETHRSWWNRYYPASFISVPDSELEKFYWIQMYKLASGTRSDRPALDLMGPWMDLTPWPAIWWNLNIQLTYWPVYAANRLELGESLCRMLDANMQNLIRNVPEPFRHDSAAIGRVSGYDCFSPVDDKRNAWGPEHGNLTWACHNYWLQYRYSMDETMLRDRLFPLLRRAVCYYLHLLHEEEDGKYHLPVAVSPEYEQLAADTNYDLSLLRWGCETLIAICSRLKLADPLLPRWREVIDKLTDYPIDETGVMIGKDVPLSSSHRHASHLLMIYPLYLINAELPESRGLIEKSLEHWIHFKGALSGYSYTIASSLYASLGRGNEAQSCLKSFFSDHLLPNTMFRAPGPCIETPLSAATSLHDMLLQSWGDKIRVFPALPDEWKDVAIHQMRTEGAFLVSALRKGGVTQFIRIESLSGEPCRVQTDLPLPLYAEWLPLESGAAIPERNVRVNLVKSENGRTLVEIDLFKNERVLLFSEGNPPVH